MQMPPLQSAIMNWGFSKVNHEVLKPFSSPQHPGPDGTAPNVLFSNPSGDGARMRRFGL
jgi:hypothetical protein